MDLKQLKRQFYSMKELILITTPLYRLFLTVLHINNLCRPRWPAFYVTLNLYNTLKSIISLPIGIYSVDQISSFPLIYFSASFFFSEYCSIIFCKITSSSTFIERSTDIVPFIPFISPRFSPRLSPIFSPAI